MKPPQASKSRHSNGTRGKRSLFLPNELITEVLSYLPVKSLMQFKCVCKSWKTLISSPTFADLHFKQSPKNKHITLFHDYTSILPFPVRPLLGNKTSLTLADDPYFRLNSHNGPTSPIKVIGSSNGLLCLHGSLFTPHYKEIFFYIWNPATRIFSEKIVFLDSEFHRGNPPPPIQTNGPWKFWFGYHNSTDTYKIVALFPKAREVRVFNLSDGVWRIIQRFPLVSLNTSVFLYTHMAINNGVYVSGTLNWLVIQNTGNESPYDYFGERITVDNFVIISLDLSTETYRQLRLPRGFDKVPPVEPTLVVLMDSICFSHDFHKTHFIIWQMKEFGVEDSWTQFLKISYHRLLIIYQGPDYMPYLPELLLPLCLSENGDTLILAWDNNKQAILYNLRDNKVEKTRITNRIQWFCTKECVESLISPNRIIRRKRKNSIGVERGGKSITF